MRPRTCRVDGAVPRVSTTGGVRASKPPHTVKRAPTSTRSRHVTKVAEVEAPAQSTNSDFSGVDVPKATKPRIVVLGSGWGAISFMKALKKSAASRFEVILLSPRNYFLYTPLLPAVATGTMEERSIVEPIRNAVVDKGTYYEAACNSVDPESKTLVACFPKDAGFPEACFRMSYDHLIVSVGSVNNTFGIKGVEEHCYFFKGIDDANKLRNQVNECFERAALPYTPVEDKKRMLSFVIVGGGPTGVEVAAELYDMITQDMKRLYPSEVQYAKIRVIELMDYVLSAYDRKIGEYTGKLFKRNGIDLVLNTKVTNVDSGCVTVVDKDGAEETIPFGACVWATGVAMNPLIKSMQAQLEGQNHFRALLTDDKLRVLGSGGSIWAIGDASTIATQRALDYADELFEQADEDESDSLSLSELRKILETASERFPQFEEHARFLNTSSGISRFGGIVLNAFSRSKEASDTERLLGNITEESRMSREEFKEMLRLIDLGLRGLPATAQVARQQGEWLASEIFGKHLHQGEPMPDDVGAFEYKHKGSLAYVGQDRAVLDVPVVGPVWGLGAGVIWKSFETYSQFSLRNKMLVLNDWLRTKLFGRDISRV